MNYLAGMLMSLSVALTIGLPTDVFQFLNQTKLHATLQLAGCGKSIVPEEGPDRIVGGRMALPGEFPWMVSLREKDSLGFEHVCGGAILNRNWIITAAHCLDSTSTRMYDVMVGLHRLSKEYTDQAKLHKLSKIILHENYDDDTFENDIALLKTSKPIDIAGSGGYVNGVCLPTSSKDPTGTATVSGWGHTRSEGENADTLRTVDVPMVPRDMCNYAYDEDPYDAFDEVLESMICAGSRGRDSCQNDSGGPLIQRKNGKATLIGIVSHGNGCGLKYFPGVYTKVSYFMKWIERNAV